MWFCVNDKKWFLFFRCLWIGTKTVGLLKMKQTHIHKIIIYNNKINLILIKI